jgi:hypothetical protein
MKRTLPTLLGVLLLSTSASAQTVNTCGQTVTDGVVAQDLDCTHLESGYAVIVRSGGSLDVAGHQILSAEAPEDGSPAGAILCMGSCTIRGGGGELVKAGESPTPPLVQSNAVGVDSPQLPDARPKVVVSDLTVRNYRWGLSGVKLRARGVTLVENRVGLVSKRSRIRNSFIAENGQGISAARTRLRNSEVSENVIGIVAAHVTLENSSVIDQDDFGIFAVIRPNAGMVVATDSVIDGNCTEDLSDPCFDLFTSGNEAPELVNTPCSRSGRYDYATDTRSTWGVCSED